MTQQTFLLWLAAYLIGAFCSLVLHLKMDNWLNTTTREPALILFTIVWPVFWGAIIFSAILAAIWAGIRWLAQWCVGKLP
jgi:hypothetical protein